MSFFTFLTETDDLFQYLDPDTQIGVSAGAIAAGFEYTNMQLSDISRLYVSAPISGGYDLIVNINLGAPTSWNQLMLINHDFDPSVVVTVKSGTTGATSDHTDVMTYREFDMYMRTAATRTDQYIQFHVADAITAAHSYSLGRVMLGLATTLTSNFSYEWEMRDKVINKSKRSDVHSRDVDRIIEYQELMFVFEEMTDAQMASLRAFTKSLHGDAVYCFLIPDPSVYEGYIMTMSSEVVFVRNRRNRAKPLIFTEESRGARISA